MRRLLAALLLAPAMFAQAVSLPSIADTAVRSTLTRFASEKLKPEEIALTLVDLRDPAKPERAGVRGGEMIYPASVIKLFYLAATHRWMEDGRLTDTPEVRRAMKDMIVDSSNDATHYLIDLLTGTTSGPELPEAEIGGWFEKRNAVTRHFTSLGYTGVYAHKKPWGDGPYGRESQAIRLYEPKRNMLTTDDTARLLVEIVNGQCVTPARSREMLELLKRDPAAPTSDPDDQAKFSGPGLPAGTRLWSKAGWTSQTRHDAIHVELPGGARFILVTFTVGHASNREILRHVASEVSRAMAAR